MSEVRFIPEMPATTPSAAHEKSARIPIAPEDNVVMSEMTKREKAHSKK